LPKKENFILEKEINNTATKWETILQNRTKNLRIT
jgi:hypothetical protein